MQTLQSFEEGAPLSALWRMRLEGLARPARPAQAARVTTIGSAPDSSPAERLRVVPLTLKQAQTFIAQHRRPHRPPVGAKFAVCAAQKGQRVGVVAS